MTPSFADDSVLGRVDALFPVLVELRRDLHRHPELAFEEAQTTERVGSLLSDAGITVNRLPGTGLVADIGPGDAAYRVALRADMDALPVTERTNLSYSSAVPGVAHACGHDVHVAACLGAGLALAMHTGTLTEAGVATRLIFQPAEEVIPGGAQPISDSRWLDDVDEIFALHCDPSLDIGQIGLRVGALTAASDRVTVRLAGSGGHTSRPQLTQDLVFALAKVATEVPAALSRRLDPRAGASLVWGMVQAGGAPNVIPSEGVLDGTLRVLDSTSWERAGSLVEDLVHTVVAPYAVQADVLHVRGVPPVINTRAAIEVLRRAAGAAGLADVPIEQSMGGEDFAWYLQRVPGAMGRLGTRTPGGPTYDLHQGDLVVDESSVRVGARVLAGTVVARCDGTVRGK
ncbi:MAG: amidohydrolase [Dermatophilaceae bacterium]